MKRILTMEHLTNDENIILEESTLFIEAIDITKQPSTQPIKLKPKISNDNNNINKNVQKIDKVKDTTTNEIALKPSEIDILTDLFKRVENIQKKLNILNNLAKYNGDDNSLNIVSDLKGDLTLFMKTISLENLKEVESLINNKITKSINDLEKHLTKGK